MSSEKFVYHVTFSRGVYAEEWYVLAVNHTRALVKAISGSEKNGGLWVELKNRDTINPVRISNVKTSFTDLKDVQLVYTKNVRLLP